MTRLVLVLKVGACWSCARSPIQSSVAATIFIVEPGIEVISLKTESDVYIGGAHRAGRGGQAVLHRTDHRIHVGNVDVIQSVVGLEPQFEAFAAALAANSKVTSKRRVEGPRPGPRNGIASRVAQLTRQWSGEGIQI